MKGCWVLSVNGERGELIVHSEDPSSPAEIAATRLRLGVSTIQITSQLELAGIQSLVLKGPSFARWLYDDANDRSFVDVDLLVDPTRVAEAGEALERLGFRPPPPDLPGNRPRVASAFIRPDGCAIDLHKTIFGVGVESSRAWEILWRHAEPFDLYGASIRVLDERGRTVHVTLHAAQSGPAEQQPIRDLSLALEKVPFSVWREAARLAVELNATSGFATGLRLLPQGHVMAQRLGISTARSIESELTSVSLPDLELSFAMGFEWLANREGFASKLRYILNKAFPPRAWIRGWWPGAHRSPVHLAVAYPMRWIWLTRHLPAGYRAWRRAKREASDSTV